MSSLFILLILRVSPRHLIRVLITNWSYRSRCHWHRAVRSCLPRWIPTKISLFYHCLFNKTVLLCFIINILKLGTRYIAKIIISCITTIKCNAAVKSCIIVFSFDIEAITSHSMLNIIVHVIRWVKAGWLLNSCFMFWIVLRGFYMHYWSCWSACIIASLAI